ncbi:F-box domain-containing protein [Coniochaeta hoffmannii]|uniref:F-box domain-containing protein n=1 Tax=Coniochaeta hoffmannii TaxID=91930 RepID=A0AA38R740_9PEZI|nr:F-box domain-containing protein [Coniochaeta hoffmannii]
MAVLRRLKDNQLHSFSWDLGTCVPSEILGDRGIIPLKQPLLRSLSLTTNALCFGDGDVEPVDLSSFHHLQSLCWRAIHGRDVDALYLVIQLNKSRLRTLELDFVNWQKFLDYQDLSSDEEDGNDEGTSMANSFFADHILCLDRRRPRQLLPQLRVLNLTQVALVGAMAHAINFDTLRSLTLRMCPGWTDFVKTALQLKVSLRLITLEIQDTDAVSISGEYVIRDLINEFTGLEELFISQTGPVETLDLWKTIARCHPTLRRLVHHQRTINTDWEDPNFEEEVDLDDLAIFGREGRIMKEDPLRNNPLARLDLDCIGLCCRPNRRLKHILLPYRVIPSLKLLHIRQSAADLKLYASWFQGNSPPMVSLATTGEDPQVTEEENEEESNSGREDSMAPSWADSGPPSPIDDTEDAAFNPDDDENAAVAESGRLNWPKLLPETQRFASWAFGPHGIPSLQIIAFGDYAHGGRATSNRFFLCRCTEEGRRFRYLSEYDRMGKELYLEYRNVLQACPVEPLLGQE